MRGRESVATARNSAGSNGHTGFTGLGLKIVKILVKIGMMALFSYINAKTLLGYATPRILLMDEISPEV